MCDRPFYINNPWRGKDPAKGLNYLHDCVSVKLAVPCGRCPTCIALKQSYFVQRAQAESFDNYIFFGTLTYKNSMLRSLYVNGRFFKYADFKDVQNAFKRIRNDNLFTRPFRYIVVSEYGGRKHRPHFHLLISIPKYSEDDKWTPYNLEQLIHDQLLSQWVRNVGSRKFPKYLPLCDYIVTPYGRTYDLHYVRPEATVDGESDVAFYVSKYILKYSKYVDKLHSALKLNLSPDEFKDVWFFLSPRATFSKGWGNPHSDSVKSHVRKGIDSAISNRLPYPVFINPTSGQEFPLCPYFKKRFLTLQDAHSFHFFAPESDSNYTRMDAQIDVQNACTYDFEFDEILDYLDSKYSSDDDFAH